MAEIGIYENVSFLALIGALGDVVSCVRVSASRQESKQTSKQVITKALKH